MAFAGLRTIRGQLIASLVLFELLALGLFTAVLLKERDDEAHQRMMRRLEYQASELAVVSRLALRDNDMEMLHTVVTSMLQFPTISAVKVTDAAGLAIAASDARLNGTRSLSIWEMQQIPEVHALNILVRPDGDPEAVMPVRLQGSPMAYIWIYPKDSGMAADSKEVLRVVLLGAFAVILGCTVLAALIARSLTNPLTRLLAATRMIIKNPEDVSAFPLRVNSSNEAADLTIAFNLMVDSIEEQRRGLGDTLALLDSMLANAPIGIAFFDRQARFVRANRFLAESESLGPAGFLGCRVDEVFSPEAAAALAAAIEQVFEHGTSVQDLEVTAFVAPDMPGANAGADAAEKSDEIPGSVGSMHAGSSGNGASSAGSVLDPNQNVRTWLANVYPVRTAAQATRWAGVVLVDITERLRAEEALRRTEKLAVTGRLSASIAHEINNPLEAVTNLLYLLRHHGTLGAQEAEWTEAAQHEVARVSQMTQQTLRFYRQSTKPVQASLTELMDSVLTLHQGRFNTLQVELERRYRDTGSLVCFTGELRQLFANLVGNALDAMQPGGGKLVVEVHASRLWKGNQPPGVRVTVADTGCGMSRVVRKRIFEPFYTTKEATGTGLGLWVGAEIMQKHQVTLQIRSRERAADHNGNGASSHGSGDCLHVVLPGDPHRKRLPRKPRRQPGDKLERPGQCFLDKAGTRTASGCCSLRLACCLANAAARRRTLGHVLGLRDPEAVHGDVAHPHTAQHRG